MKISIDIDCTPEEARRFFGLPDVTAMQDRVLKEMEAKILAGMDMSNAEDIMQSWFSGGMKGMDQLQKAFWSQFGQGSGGKSGGKPDTE